MNGAVASSTVDAERPDRASSMSASRPWVDPTVKMQVNLSLDVSLSLSNVQSFPFSRLYYMVNLLERSAFSEGCTK